MTCVPAYLADGDAVFLEFGDGTSVQSQQAQESQWSEWSEEEDALVGEDLEEIKLVRLPCDSDEE